MGYFVGHNDTQYFVDDDGIVYTNQHKRFRVTQADEVIENKGLETNSTMKKSKGRPKKIKLQE